MALQGLPLSRAVRGLARRGIGSSPPNVRAGTRRAAQARLRRTRAAEIGEASSVPAPERERTEAGTRGWTPETSCPRVDDNTPSRTRLQTGELDRQDRDVIPGPAA